MSNVWQIYVKSEHENGSMLVCQDPSCKTKKDVKTKTKARCPQCKKRLTKFGTGKKRRIAVSVVIPKRKNIWINALKIKVKTKCRNEK